MKILVAFFSRADENYFDGDLNILGSHRFASASESDVQEWLDSVS